MGLLPIHRQDRSLGRVLFQQPFHGADSLCRLDEFHALPGPASLILISKPGSHPHLGPGSPIDAQRWQSVAATVMSQSVEECIRGGIVALTGRSEERRARRKEDKEIELEVFREGMQIPGPIDFWSHDGFKPRPGLFEKDAIIQHASGVNDPTQGRPVLPDGTQDVFKLLSFRNISLDNMYMSA